MGSYKDYLSIFQDASQKYNVDMQLLLGVAHTESNFNPNATSSVGAKGIMQLMDGTAKSLGVNNSYDAEQNIMGGAKYLGQLLEKYDGDTDKALASYFAGSGNVSKFGASKYSYYYDKVYKNMSNYESYKGGVITTPIKDSPSSTEDKNIIHSALNIIVLVLVFILGVYCIFQSISTVGNKSLKGAISKGKKKLEREVQNNE